MGERISVLLTTEGTYPFHQGGVSTWCDMLVKRLNDIDFVVYSVLMDPFVTQKFDLPAGTDLIRMPLWGTEEPNEHKTTPFSRTYLAKIHTTDKVVAERFIPLFHDLVTELIATQKDPQRFARTIFGLYQYFQEFDYKVSFKSGQAWETYKEIILAQAADQQGGLSQPDIYCLIQSLGWIYRFFNIINTSVPRTHVVHSSAAAFCGLPCVISKMLYGTPFLLTEHGVYLREQYLSLSKRGYPSFLNTFLVRMIRSITSVNYAFADQISPVCTYNTRWELEFGSNPDKIEVIYNGVDPAVFSQADLVAGDRPTVVAVARIDPIKDIETMLHCAAQVREAVPDVQFVVYGSVSVEAYYERCVSLRDELGLGDACVFAGHNSNVVTAYQQADVVVQSSISEAFPYSVIEAMMAGKPVVSTDVGGISEAIGQTGVLVAPRDAQALADGVIQLLMDKSLRQVLGQEARDRALNLFTLDRTIDQYRKAYIKLAVHAHDLVPVADPDANLLFLPESRTVQASQQLYAERGYALLANGFADAAVQYLEQAVAEHPDSAATPVFLLELSSAYQELGDPVRADLERSKSAVLMALSQM